jgi:hypothetical protein
MSAHINAVSFHKYDEGQSLFDDDISHFGTTLVLSDLLYSN